jgi:hypothetical protein
MVAAFSVTAMPASAQDRRPSAKKDAAATEAQKRAAAKRQEAALKKRAAEQAAAAAAQAEAEADAAEEAAAPADELSTEEVPEEAATADPALPEDGVAADDDHEPDEPVASKRDQRRPNLRRDRRRPRRPARRRRPPRETYAPSPDAASPPPFQYSGPYTMEYIEGADVPDGYTKVERVRKGLVIGGAVTFGVGWLIAATAAASLDEDIRDEAAPLFVPVVGPFIAMGTLDPDGAGRAALFVNGMMQTAGAAMLIGGLAGTKTVLVRTAETEIHMRPGVGSLQFDGTF